MRDTSWHAEPLRRSSVQLGWLAVFLACAFVLVALIGYTPADPTRLHPGPGAVSNPCGPVGANVADLLFWGFGYGAWSVFLGMVASVLALAGRPLQPVHEWFLFGIGLFGACGVFAVLLPHPGVYGPGGKVGETVVHLFTPWLGTVGTLLVCSSIGVFCLVAVFRISLQQVAARSVAVGESVLSWSGRAVGGAIARSFQGPPELVVEEFPIDSVLPSRDPAPERLALPPPRYRASPLAAPRITPDLPALEPRLDAEILPLVDPSDADVVFETTDPFELESRPYLPPPRRGLPPRMISARPAAGPRRVSPRPAAHRAVVHHVPTPAEVESDSLIGLFPDVGPRESRRGPRMSLVPPPRSVPPRPGQVGERVVEVLRDLRLYGRVTTVWEGPVVTTVGVRPERLIDPETIGRRADAIASALGVEAVRVVEWGGTRDVGIEVPSLPRRPVHLDTVLSGRPDLTAEVPLALGVDVRGAPVFTDLAAMSHLAVVGQPTSGKSNALRSMVSSLLAHPPSRGLALVLMTPEAGLFAPFAGRRELAQEVVRRGRVAKVVLRSVVKEIERRRLAATPRGATPRDHVLLAPGSRSGTARKARWVVVIDRWNAFDAESSSLGPLVSTVAEQGAAVGVHLVIAMRKPAGFVRRAEGPVGRLAMTMGSAEASHAFLGRGGAETLLGQGDALWLSPDGTLARIHVPDASLEPAVVLGHSLPPG